MYNRRYIDCTVYIRLEMNVGRVVRCSARTACRQLSNGRQIARSKTEVCLDGCKCDVTHVHHNIIETTQHELNLKAGIISAGLAAAFALKKISPQ